MCRQVLGAHLHNPEFRQPLLKLPVLFLYRNITLRIEGCPLLWRNSALGPRLAQYLLFYIFLFLLWTFEAASERAKPSWDPLLSNLFCPLLQSCLHGSNVIHLPRACEASPKKFASWPPVVSYWQMIEHVLLVMFCTVSHSDDPLLLHHQRCPFLCSLNCFPHKYMWVRIILRNSIS